MSRPAALPIEKWKRHTVSGEDTASYSEEGTGQVGHPRLDLLGKDVRLEARRSQVLLDGLRLVADGVAVAQGGQQLVDAPGAAAHGGATGAGTDASRRPASGATRESRSRYFRSITSHE